MLFELFYDDLLVVFMFVNGWHNYLAVPFDTWYVFFSGLSDTSSFLLDD